MRSGSTPHGAYGDRADAVGESEHRGPVWKSTPARTGCNRWSASVLASSANYGQLRRNTDRSTPHRLARLANAITFIITTKPIDCRTAGPHQL